MLADQLGVGLNLMIGGGLGVAIVCTSYVMWRSGLFSTALCVTGLVSGVAIVGAQLTVSPGLAAVFDVLYFFPLVFWVWMIWAGVVSPVHSATSRRPSDSAPAARHRSTTRRVPSSPWRGVNFITRRMGTWTRLPDACLDRFGPNGAVSSSVRRGDAGFPAPARSSTQPLLKS